MEFTAAANWLNTTFAGFDNGILEFMHTLETSAGAVLTPLAKFITLIGEKGILMFVLAFAFMLFPKTRKLGVCMFGAVCCGALITNIILKDLVARPRPFEAMAPFLRYWNDVGSPVEDGFSFPSGHVTAAAAGMAAIMFVKGRKYILPSALYVFLMCFSRNYLMAHYPSDVLAASLVGLFSAFIAYLIASFIFEYCEDNDDLPFFNTVLNFSLPLPDMSGLINKINRVPARDSKAKAAKRKGSAHVSGKESGKHSVKESGKHSPRESGKHSGKHSAKPQNDDDFSFTVDMTDELLADTGNIDLDIDALKAEEKAEEKTEDSKPNKTSRAVKSEKPAASSLLNNIVAGAKSKAAGIAKASASASKSGAKKTIAPRPEAAMPSIHTAELDFDFDAAPVAKKQQRPTSDWNTRWEEYLARRDQAQVKTAPAAQGSAQMEFENIFAKSAKSEDTAAQPEESGKGKSEDDLSNTLRLFGDGDSAADEIEDDVKEYKPGSKTKKARSEDVKPAEEKPAVKAEPKEPAPAEKPAEPPKPAATEHDAEQSFDHMRRRPGTDTGSIELDMDEIYSLLNGSYDFTRE